MTPPEKVDARFLLERELAGTPRRALMALYPRRLWPEHWIDEDTEQVPDQEDEDR